MPHVRGVVHNVIAQAVCYLILAIAFAVWPFVVRIWHKPFQSSVNGVLFIFSIGLFVMALVQVARALHLRPSKAEGTHLPKRQSLIVYDLFSEAIQRGEAALDKFRKNQLPLPTPEHLKQIRNELITISENFATVSERQKLRNGFQEADAAEAISARMYLPTDYDGDVVVELVGTLKIARRLRDRLYDERD
jgi:hypothetical protein